MERIVSVARAHRTKLIVAFACALVLSMLRPYVRPVPAVCHDSEAPEWVRERALVRLGVEGGVGGGREVIYADLYVRPLWLFDVLLVRRAHVTGGIISITCF